MIRLYRPSFVVRCFYRKALFRLKTEEKTLCLTFDDGPFSGSTEKILNILGKKGVKAIFFCSGRQAAVNPALTDTIRYEGHLTGNHGYFHISGFSVSTEEYLKNCDDASAFTSDRLFRPPYGRLTPVQYRKLSQKFTIFFWDLMVYDFDKNIGAKRSLDILKRKIRPGSIIVLHDTPDSSVHGFLEEFIEYCMSEGYRFVLPD